MSAQYCVATALKHGRITMSGMLDFTDPILNDLIAKTEVIADENLSSFCCILEVETNDGRNLVEELIVSSKFYDYSFEEDIEILREIVPDMLISPDKFDQLIAAVAELERLDDIGAIIKYLTRE